MNESSTNETIINNGEFVQEVVEQETMGVEAFGGEKTTEEVVDGTGSGVVIQKQSKESTKKVNVPKIFDFFKKHILTKKIASIITIVLGIAITALSILQIVFWAPKLRDLVSEKIELYSTITVIEGLGLALVLIFSLALVIKSIKAIVSLLRRGHNARLDTVVTLFSFYIVSIFFLKMFGTEGAFFTVFSCSLLKTLLILTLIYSIFYFIVKDIKSRLWSCIFCILSIIIVVLMYKFNIGSYAQITLVNSELTINVGDLNTYNFFKGITNDGIGGVLEYSFLNDMLISIEDIGEEMAYLVFLIEFIIIFVSDILPFLAISLIGYLIYGISSKNYMQYYNIEHAKKVAITLLFFAIMGLAATIALFIWCNNIEALVQLEIDYLNVSLTLGLTIILMIFLSMPWKIYNITYQRLYRQYKQSEVNKKNGTTTM